MKAAFMALPGNIASLKTRIARNPEAPQYRIFLLDLRPYGNFFVVSQACRAARLYENRSGTLVADSSEAPSQIQPFRNGDSHPGLRGTLSETQWEMSAGPGTHVLSKKYS